MHKIITYFFTGKKINFGNYSCLIKEDVRKLSTLASLWSSFSGSVKKNLESFNEIESERGTRYFGPSKMSFLKLLIHSFSIIAVFKYNVFIRSVLMLIVLTYSDSFIGNLAIFFQILIVVFNLLIFIISMREQEKDLLNSHNNLGTIKKITQ